MAPTMVAVSRRPVLHGAMAAETDAPVEESERFRRIQASAVKPNVNYVTSAPGSFTTQVRSLVDNGSVRAGFGSTTILLTDDQHVAPQGPLCWWYDQETMLMLEVS